MENWKGIVREYASCREMLEKWPLGHYVTGHPALIQMQGVISEMYGRPSILTSRGMTAISTTIVALTRVDDIVACSVDVYPGTKVLLRQHEQRGYVKKIIWFDPTRQEEVSDALSQGAAMVIVETFGNSPQMRVADIPLLTGMCGRALLLVDSTFTPSYVPPRSDNLVLVGSMTKYEDPKDELMGGRISACSEVIERIKATRIFNDSVMHYLFAQGYLSKCLQRTLNPEYQMCSHDSKTLALLCQASDAVAEVSYPGLETHPQNSLVRKDYWGLGGGVFYFRLKGGEAAAIKFSDGLASGRFWSIGVSLGSENWRILPWIGQDLRNHVGCEGLIRVSAGRNNPLAIIDFSSALKQLG